MMHGPINISDYKYVKNKENGLESETSTRVKGEQHMKL